MTENELTPHLARLTHIWKPLGPFTVKVWEGYLEKGVHLRNYDSSWELQGRLKNNYVIRLVGSKTVPVTTAQLMLCRSRYQALKFNGVSLLIWYDGEILVPHYRYEELAETCARHFKRDCFLSGLPVEGTWHEKMTWVDHARQLGLAA